MKTINLIPDDIRAEWRLKGVRKALLAAALLYLAALGAVYMSQRSRISSIRAERAAALAEKEDLISRSAEFLELTRKYREIQQAESGLRKKLSLASDITGKRVSWSTVLKRLSHDMPAVVWLRSLSTSDVQGAGKKVRFLGSSTSNRGITDFVFTLENTAYFQDVALLYSQKRDFKSGTVYDFEVSALLKKADDIMYEW